MFGQCFTIWTIFLKMCHQKMLNLPGILCQLDALFKIWQKRNHDSHACYIYIYYCKLTKLCIVMNIFQYGIWYHAFLMRFLAKGRGWWILCLLFTQRTRLQSLCPCCLKLTTSHHHHNHHHHQEVLFSHSLTLKTHTGLNCLPVRRKKGS
jgi:hypothetical protein